MNTKRNTAQFVLITSLFLVSCQSTVPTIATTDIRGTNCQPIIYSYGTFSELGFDYNIVSVCPDGSAKQRLTVDGQQNSGAAWSPDGRNIAFYSASSGSPNLHLMDADGGNQRQLTGETDLEFSHSLWMPDGQNIALLARTGNQPWEWQLIDVETAQTRPFGDWPADPDFHPVAFSHSGNQLVYLALADTSSQSTGLTRQIHIQNRDGSNDLTLTDGARDSINPRWSPDDNQIAFLAEIEASDGQYALYIINADGSQLRQVTQRLFSRDAYFDWSPDGQSFVIYSHHKLFTMDFYSGEIMVEIASIPDLAGEGQDSGNGLNIEQMGIGLSW